MNYQVGQQLHGFEIKRIRELDEINATMIELEHINTKGQMVFLKRADTNMTFSVTMKTLPKDDTGIFHILEHSTLGGSKKYPVKEPFVELLKSSMNTFLNAMTFPDKTCYPVSSQNKKDFLNLTEVYLDAVFAPSVVTKKDIFLQEGWHYELLNKEDTPIYKGVVFNEMKGAYTSVDTYIESGMNKLLFQDNCYQYDSGGYPATIPELTYESFLEQHHKFYSMSNARFFLDGDAPLEEVLALIEEYAKDEEYIEVDSTINPQEEKTGLFNTISYPIDENEDTEGKAQISFGKLAGNYDEMEKMYAYKILCNYLTSSNDSPIKKAILEKGLAQDVILDLYDGIQQPWLSLTAKYTDSKNLEEIKSTILDVLKHELEEGLDHSIIEANLSYLEFKAKERGSSSYPEGLANNLSVLDSWLYGGDPALFLEINDTFKSLREKLVQGYFESLIQDFLENKDYTATLVVEPSKTLSKELEEQETAKLKKIADSWDEATRERLVEENQHLLAWQQSVDTKEQLETMPSLSLSDLDEKIDTYPYSKSTYKDVPVIKYQLNSHGITYLHLFFSMKDIKQEDLPLVTLYSALLGELPTEKYDVIKLQTMMKSKFGAMTTSIAYFDELGNTKVTLPYFTVKCSFLDENAKDAYALLDEIICHTDFNQTKKIKDLFAQMETSIQQGVMMSGHSFGVKRILASHSARGAAAELASGYTFYEFLKQFNTEFDDRIPCLIEYFNQFKSIYTTGNLTVTYNGEANVNNYIDLLTESSRHDEVVSYQLLPVKNDRIKVPTQVSYGTLGGNLYEVGSAYDPKFRVLSKIISLEYLWNEVRVKGGAYGCGLNVSRSGDVFFYSYRDPSANKSLDIYKNTTKFIEDYCGSKDNVDKFIISTLADDAILSIPGKIGAADYAYFSHLSDETKLANKKAILTTTIGDIKELVNEVQKVIEQDHTCIIGNED